MLTPAHPAVLLLIFTPLLLVLAWRSIVARVLIICLPVSWLAAQLLSISNPNWSLIGACAALTVLGGVYVYTWLVGLRQMQHHMESVQAGGSDTGADRGVER